jgi:hypothetical protein
MTFSILHIIMQIIKIREKNYEHFKWHFQNVLNFYNWLKAGKVK